MKEGSAIIWEKRVLDKNTLNSFLARDFKPVTEHLFFNVLTFKIKFTVMTPHHLQSTQWWVRRKILAASNVTF